MTIPEETYMAIMHFADVLHGLLGCLEERANGDGTKLEMVEELRDIRKLLEAAPLWQKWVSDDSPAL